MQLELSILNCIEVNQLAQSAPSLIEGEGLGMIVARVARY